MSSPHSSCDFEVNQTKIKGGCQSGREVVPHDSKSDLPLGSSHGQCVPFYICIVF